MSAVLREIYHHGTPGAGTFDLLMEAASRNCGSCAQKKRRKTGILVYKADGFVSQDRTVAEAICMECAKKLIADYSPTGITAGRAAEGSD